VSARVSIIDYGSGNLFSVARAFEHVGVQVELADTPKAIDNAQRLVLPGVGAFAEGMQGLRDRGMIESIMRYAASGRPLLGICLGMQMLASLSQEFGDNIGLGVIPGRVLSLPTTDVDGHPHRIPHIGWVELEPSAPGRWDDSLCAGMPAHGSVYLVHSFHFVPDDPEHRLAECCYGGHRLVAAIQSGNTTGFQFHPEKSGDTGLRLLRAFLSR